MNHKKVIAALLVTGMALSAPLAALAKNPHGGGGGGGGGGGSQAGGLPALAKRVAADEALIKALQTSVSGLGSTSFAVVATDGNLARSNSAAGPVSVAHTVGTGLYEVDFAADVSACAYGATLGDTGTATPPLGTVAVSSALTLGGVTVQTTDLAGTPTDEPFHLTVTCP